MITRDPSDRETVSLVTNFLEAVGEENVFVDSVLNEETTEDDTRIPQPKLNSVGSSRSVNTFMFSSIYLSLVLFSNVNIYLLSSSSGSCDPSYVYLL